jgi:hypothetical protein
MATHQELINPPTDVQAAVAAVIKACGEWQPTQVENLPPHLPVRDLKPTTPNMSEAMVCSFIQNPTAAAAAWMAFDTGVMLSVLLVGFILITGIYRLPRTVWRLVRRLAMKAPTYP